MSPVLLFPLKVMCYDYCLLWCIPEALSLHVLTFFFFSLHPFIAADGIWFFFAII